MYKFINNGISNSLSLIENLFYPQFCVSCEKLLPINEPLYCSGCRDSFKLCIHQNRIDSLSSGNHIDYAFAIYPFDKDLQNCIHHWKYNGFSKLILHLLSPHKSKILQIIRKLKINYLVPVPLHHVKMRERGFNQALQLAEKISSISGIPISNCLRRKKWTKSQTKLNVFDRRKNTNGAFVIKSKLIGGKVLLIDDVVTTGATANSCAEILKSSGVEWTGIFTLGIA